MARNPQSGVSLVEVLVVLVLVAVMAGAMSLRFGGGSGEVERREATRLAVQLTQAAEAALTTGEGAQISWDGSRYQVGDQPPTALTTPIRNQPDSYPITPDLLPALSGPLRLTLGDTVVVFDGARAFVLPEVF